MELQLRPSILLKATLARINKHRQIPITYLKPKQIQCILQGAAGNDVLGILPTGYGKSLIFQAIPIYISLSKQRSSKTIVVSPLNVIIEQQLQTLGSDALRVQQHTSMSSDSSDENHPHVPEAEADDYPSTTALKCGTFKFLVGHPEEFLNPNTIKVMRASRWAKDVSTIVVDEAHCVVQWSTDFRPVYRDLDQLRALFPNASIVALTATASVRMRKDILRLLNMDNACIVSAQVDRVNIKYSVVKRPSNSAGVETSYTAVFVPIIEELKSQGDQFPKTVVYTTLKWCGFGNELGVKMLSTGEVTLAGVPQIAQYHAPLSQEAKRIVAEDVAAKDGDIKLLLATEAYGMGVDTPDIRRVMHAGPPCTLETYAQTTGRGGRDGEDCEAVLYYNNEDLGKVTMTKEMREFCRTDSCRREYLCAYFASIPAFSGISHRCCDICAMTCTCADCSVLINREDTSSVKSNHCDYAERITYNSLIKVFGDINQALQICMDPELFTGLTKALARDIAANCELFRSEDALRVNYFHIEPENIKIIYHVISSCLRIASKRVSQNRNKGVQDH